MTAVPTRAHNGPVPGYTARACRYLWALPTTAVGLLAVTCIWVSGGRVRWRDGIVEACGGAIGPLFMTNPVVRGGIAAMALGHVVLAVDDEALRRTRAHERVHVQQAERWGPLFIPAYLAASAWQLWCGRDPYRDNPFEREAFACDAPMVDPDAARANPVTTAGADTAKHTRGHSDRHPFGESAGHGAAADG